MLHPRDPAHRRRWLRRAVVHADGRRRRGPWPGLDAQLPAPVHRGRAALGESATPQRSLRRNPRDLDLCACVALPRPSQATRTSALRIPGRARRRLAPPRPRWPRWPASRCCEAARLRLAAGARHCEAGSISRAQCTPMCSVRTTHTAWPETFRQYSTRCTQQQLGYAPPAVGVSRSISGPSPGCGSRMRRG